MILFYFQLRLSINCALLEGSNFQLKRVKHKQCQFCFKQYDNQFQGSVCTLCKREFCDVNSQEKVAKRKGVQLIDKSSVEPVKKRKHRVREINAGLVIPRKIVNKPPKKKAVHTTPLIPGQSEASRYVLLRLASM